jgi:uncharacterized protein YkwD
VAAAAALLLGLALALPVPAAFAASPEDSVVALVNQARARAGCPPVKADRRLEATARAHARDMAERDFFAHEAPGKGKPKARARKQGYKGSTIGETIAAGQRTPAEAVEFWMNSPGHRKIILTCRLTEAGAGMFHQEDDQPILGMSYPLRTYWVLNLAKR